ncbi:hypothetical protein R84981_001683 [Carnimonas sp. R-84981]|uniref:hypothetical protein n=1 Tax=Carnimonas bestiolae TaxID=3402172 RepID=UPI003EDC17E1
MSTSSNVYSAMTHPAVPSQHAIDTLNEVRRRYGIFTTHYSDIFACTVDDGPSEGPSVSLGQRALNIIGHSYKSNNKLRWGSQLKEEQIYAIPNWRYINDSGSVASRTKFAKAYELVEACSYGLWGNAVYSTSGIFKGTKGGEDNFPIYPADVRYMANGPAAAGDHPSAGYEHALGEIRSAFKDTSTYFDYLNAAAFTLVNKGVIVDGKKVSGNTFYKEVYKSFTYDNYQRYLKEVKDRQPNEIKRAAEYFYNVELMTLVFLSRKTASAITIERHSAQLSTLIKYAFLGDARYDPEAYFDTSVAPYELERMKIAVAASTNSLVKSSASALQVIINAMATDKSDIAGIQRSNEIQNLMIVLSGGAYLGSSAEVVLTPGVIDEALENSIGGSRLTFTDVTAKNKFADALKTLNTSGLLGTIGFLFNVTRAVYDTLNLKPKMESGKIPPNKVLSLISRYMGVYGGLGNCLQFIQYLNGPAKKAFLLATRALRLDQVSESIWGSAGTIATEISMAPIPALEAMDEAAVQISRNFAELPFAEETNFINSFFEQEIMAPARAMQSTGEHSVEFIVEESVTEISSQIETMTSGTISTSAAMSAVKAFGASAALVGFAGEILGFVSTIIDISTKPKIKTRDFLGLSASILSISGSTIGMGVAYGFLESAAFPPIAIGLGIASIIIGLSTAIDELVEVKQKAHKTRKDMTKLFQSFEANGYLHQWGDKIQFLAIYFDSTRDPRDHTFQVKRWSPPEVSIFVDEAAAWRAFRKASGTTQQRFQLASSKLVHAKLTYR